MARGQTSVPPQAAERDLYAPDTLTLTIAGEAFTVGPMSIRQSYQAARIVARAFARHNAQLQALATIDDPTIRERAAVDFDLLSILGPDDFLDLAVVALSGGVLALDRDWVERFCTADQAWEVVAHFITANQATLGKRALDTVRLTNALMSSTLPALETPTD